MSQQLSGSVDAPVPPQTAHEGSGATSEISHVPEGGSVEDSPSFDAVALENRRRDILEDEDLPGDEVRYRRRKTSINVPESVESATDVGRPDDYVEEAAPPALDRYKRKRLCKDWPMRSKVALAQLALKFEVWNVHGRKDHVPERWAALEREIEKEPWRGMFEGKRPSQLKSHFDCLLLYKRRSNAKAVREPDVVPPVLEGDEAVLDKLMGKCVDIIARERHGALIRRRLAKGKPIEDELYPETARNDDRYHCLQGNGATLSDAAARARVPRDDGRGSSSGGSGDKLDSGARAGGDTGEKGAVGRRSSASSSRGGARAVAPLGDALRDAGIVYSLDSIRKESRATADQMRMFATDGWERGEIPHEMAVNIFCAMLRHLGGTFEGGYFGSGSADETEWALTKFPGIGKAAIDALCDHYGVDARHLESVASKSAFSMYLNGWVGDMLPSDTVDRLNLTLARMLVAGAEYVPSSSSSRSRREYVAPAVADGHPRVAVGADGEAVAAGKRRGEISEYTPKKEVKSAEDSFFAMLMCRQQEQMLEYRERREEERVRRQQQREEDAAIRAEARVDAERRYRLDLQQRKEERDEERARRKEERDEQEARRKEEREDEKARREHDITMLRLQLELAAASKKQ